MHLGFYARICYSLSIGSLDKLVNKSDVDIEIYISKFSHLINMFLLCPLCGNSCLKIENLNEDHLNVTKGVTDVVKNSSKVDHSQVI